MSPYDEHRDPIFRWFALAILLASVGISARRRWQARRTTGVIPRSDEGPGLVAGRLAVALPLFGSVALYIANPRLMAWSSLMIPDWLRWTGVALGVLVAASVRWTLAHLGANVTETVLTKPEHRLVTTGPYRWMRHPLYTTGIGLFVSLALVAANWFILAWALVALLAVRVVVIPREEANLLSRFGESYRRYRSRTGSLLPRLRPPNSARGQDDPVTRRVRGPGEWR